MSTTEQSIAGASADALISAEVKIQDRMWGNANERADSGQSQLLYASMAQLDLTALLLTGEPEKRATAMALLEAYPKDWEGLRSYGSVVANLAVAAAFIRSEMKRRIMDGEDTTRTSRGEPYTKAIPFVSSAEAIAEQK